MPTTKDVIISVLGTQKYDGQDDVNRVELITDGTLTHDGDKYRISYLESEMTGLEGTQTTFEIERHRITLTRTGAVNSQMIFEEGRRHESLYDVGFGALLIGVRARKVQSSLDEHGGKFRMEYTIQVDNDVSAVNRYEVTVREA